MSHLDICLNIRIYTIYNILYDNIYMHKFVKSKSRDMTHIY
jgi:hypothetical protein